MKKLTALLMSACLLAMGSCKGGSSTSTANGGGGMGSMFSGVTSGMGNFLTGNSPTPPQTTAPGSNSSDTSDSSPAGLLAGMQQMPGLNRMPFLQNTKQLAMVQKTMLYVDAGMNLKTFFLLDDSQENALGQSVAVSLTNQYPAPGIDPMNKYVSLVGLCVANASPRPDLRFVFGVLNTNTINAFSGPRGYIFVTRGALASMQDEAELAGVLGHEMAHVILQHGLNQVKVSAGEKGAMEALQASKGQKTSILSDGVLNVVTKVGYDQQQEFDADRFAVDYMRSAGYDPNSYLHFLQRLVPIQTTAEGGPMSTHPGAARRVAQVTDEISKLTSQGGVTLADRFHANIKF